MINHQSFLNRFEVVVAATALQAALNQAVNQLCLINLKTKHDVHLGTTLFKHSLQRLGLRNGARETVENHAFLDGFSVIVEHAVEDANHQVVGNEFSVADVGISSFT